jgi:glycosyltransferase involved in cell wall biosynthesis
MGSFESVGIELLSCLDISWRFQMTNDLHPLVTIAIPTYNRAGGYLKQALESAVNQTYHNLEIIVSDNCSPDDTESLVKGVSDPRIRYFRHSKNIGASNNFNFCLEQASGDYFLLLHDDDQIDGDFVEVCMKGADYATSFGVLRTGTREIDSQGRVLCETPNTVSGLSTEDFFRGWFAYKTSWYFCSTLFNTLALRKIGGLQSKKQLLQDGVAIAWLAAELGRVDVPDVKATFRRHEAKLTYAAKVGDWADDFLDLLDLMCNLATEKRDLIRVEGMRFFARLSYQRAEAVRSPLRRLFAYMIVFRKFNWQYPPPPVNRFMRRSRLWVKHLIGELNGP